MTTPDPHRRQLSIEAALRWAFQIELPNLDPRQANPMFEERVSGGGGSGYEEGAISRIVAPDAIRIGDAVKLLGGADWWAGVVFPPIAYAVDGMSMADKPFIDRAVTRAETLVICHARLGNRPDCEDVPECTPLRAGNGRPEIRRMGTVEQRTLEGATIDAPLELMAKEERARVRDRPGIYELGSYCLLQWYPTVDQVMRDRADYVVWRAALDWLRQQLGGALERVAITDQLPAERPWFN